MTAFFNRQVFSSHLKWGHSFQWFGKQDCFMCVCVCVGLHMDSVCVCVSCIFAATHCGWSVVLETKRRTAILRLLNIHYLFPDSMDFLSDSVGDLQTSLGSLGEICSPLILRLCVALLFWNYWRLPERNDSFCQMFKHCLPKSWRIGQVSAAFLCVAGLRRKTGESEEWYFSGVSGQEGKGANRTDQKGFITSGSSCSEFCNIHVLPHWIPVVVSVVSFSQLTQKRTLKNTNEISTQKGNKTKKGYGIHFEAFFTVLNFKVCRDIPLH